MTAVTLLPTTRAIVDLNAVASNVRTLKGLCSRKTALMAVVKADGYGHGAVPVAATALENGASFLAVARISEAVQLRDAGIGAPLLLFGEVLPAQVPWLTAHGVRATLSSMEDARIISRAVRTMGDSVVLKVHIKVDTGMGRLGLVCGGVPPLPPEGPRHGNAFKKDREENGWAMEKSLADVVDAVAAITALPGIEVEGIYTHFAGADLPDKAHARGQTRLFGALIQILGKEGIRPEICHAANSAALMDMPESHFDMVRPGIAMYGIWPSDYIKKKYIEEKSIEVKSMEHKIIEDKAMEHKAIEGKAMELKPAISVVSNIIHIKSVPAGFRVSYGGTHITSTPTVIATVPMGYADGYSRLLSSRGEMLVRGLRCPVIGRVCMDFTMIDVGSIPDVRPGEPVVIMGCQGGERITPEEIASHAHTIGYEVVASLTGRVPRHWIPSNSPTEKDARPLDSIYLPLQKKMPSPWIPSTSPTEKGAKPPDSIYLPLQKKVPSPWIP
ncbi:MAG: alanine racemase [Desulfamplus sp.]|nr:alanine racemase [Desulfamplus sp.]